MLPRRVNDLPLATARKDISDHAKKDRKDFEFDFWGALRFSYNYSDWKPGHKKRGGDFGYDVLILPFAFPVILTGIRTMVVMTIALSILIALLALISDGLIGCYEKWLRRKRLMKLHRILHTTILFVTHDGRIEQIGSPREITSSPATSYIASLFSN